MARRSGRLVGTRGPEPGEPDDLDRAGSISDRPETNRPGLSGMLNDSDEWTLRAASLGSDGRTNTADDEQAIFLGRGE